MHPHGVGADARFGGELCPRFGRRLRPPVPLEKEEDIADRRGKATSSLGRELIPISAPAVFLADPVVEAGLAKGNAGDGEVHEKAVCLHRSREASALPAGDCASPGPVTGC